MGKIIAFVIVVLALAGGAAAGHFLRPPPEPAEPEQAQMPEPRQLEAVATFRQGFIVPVLRDGMVWSHIILSLGVSADETEQQTIIAREPVLRDAVNTALFLHGSLGGFDGDFTNPRSMARLRDRLDSVLQDRLSDKTARILIVSMARQAS